MAREIHNIKSKIVVDSRFNEVVRNLKDIKLPEAPLVTTGSDQSDSGSFGKIEKLESETKYSLDPLDGAEIANSPEYAICAYDESIASYLALSGNVVCTSHCLVYLQNIDYLPISYITLRFFTRSSMIAEKIGEMAVLTDNAKHDSAIATAKDKMAFLEEYCQPNSILLIDGPLIAGDAYTTFMPQIDRFCQNGILSAFFVKNSNSNMVLDNDHELSKWFNSDMHWSDEILNPGERTRFFKYTDSRNENNSKVFCYIKFYRDVAPVRLEFPTKIFNNFRTSIDHIVNLAYYLLIVQGDKKNPQLRPIAIAEKYARETLKVMDVNREIRKLGLTPTMNENRWGTK